MSIDGANGGVGLVALSVLGSTGPRGEYCKMLTGVGVGDGEEGEGKGGGATMYEHGARACLASEGFHAVRLKAFMLYL